MSAMTNKLTLGLLLLALFVLASCGGGGEDNTANPDGIRPSITGLSRTSADIGDTLSILGLNFGDSQSGASAKLNGIDFEINNWTDTLIEVTVAAGMTSGIVVVTVDGLDSQSGTIARLFIPISPTGDPVITAVSPNYGKIDDEIIVAGQGFGSTQGASNVIFADEDGNETVAEVVTVDVEGTPMAQWGSNTIKVLVPNIEPGNYSVYISTGTEASNVKGFLKLREDYPVDAPIILAVTPENGAVGTSITISGTNFGHSQGISNLTVGGVALDIVAWSNTVINALIPNDAQTGPLVITVGPHDPYEWTGGDFVVANAPVITGVTPAGVRMGRSFTIYGRYFGTSQGEGTVTVGGAEQTVSEWHPTASDADINIIVIDSLAPFTSSGTEMTDDNGDTIVDDFGNPLMFYEVVITADNGLTSEPEHVYLVTNLQAVVTVDPLAGQRNGPAGEAGTVFSFRAEVSGGSGNYEYTLIPDASAPGTTAPDENPGTAGVVEYTYKYSASAPDEKTYSTMMRIEDLDNGDTLTVDGPEVLVVNYGVPVITKMGVLDFNQALDLNGPNKYCYTLATGTYHDFTYLNDDVYYTSSRGGITVGGDEVTHYVRRTTNYMVDGAQPRGQGYRYYNNDGSPTNDGAIIAIRGLNFGEAMGTVELNAAGATPIPVTNFSTAVLDDGWSDTEIHFYIPAGTLHLSGNVKVTPNGSTLSANSYEPLTCSPYITNVVPGPGDSVPLDTGVVTLTGFDLSPNTIPNKVGTEEYSIWMVVASYTDPWTSNAVTTSVLLTTPVPASSVGATTIQFNAADLDVDGDGVVPVEVQDASGTETQVVDGTLAAGDYEFFLWTGAITDGTDFSQMAYSGIFSELYTVKFTDGGGPGGDPVASLSANPMSGEPPLMVSFDASASTDDGSIDNYEWDFDDDGAYGSNAEEIAAEGSPGPHTYTYAAEGNYTARVRVTDDEGNTDVDTANINVHTGGTGNTITVNVYISDWENFDATSQTLVRLYNGNPASGGTAVEQVSLDHRAAGVGNPAIGVFDELPDGSNYYLRCQTPVIHWDGDPEPEAIRDFGPYSVPPNASVDLFGSQYQEPPGPQ